jgi:hypothetical protein
MRGLTLLTLTALAAAALTGCVAARKPVLECRFPSQAAPPPGRALVAHEYGEISPIPLDAVQFTEPDLSKEIAVQLLQSHRTQTNTVQVTARFINCTDAVKIVGVRANFMDKNEFPLEPASGWQNVVLQPRSMGNYQDSSLSRTAEHYVLELRDAGN